MPGKSKIRFKSLEFKDLEKVMEIETLSNPTPWSIGSFIDCINSSYQNIVILSDNLLVGFCISTVNFTESHLLNISITLIIGLRIGATSFKRIRERIKQKRCFRYIFRGKK